MKPGIQCKNNKHIHTSTQTHINQTYIHIVMNVNICLWHFYVPQSILGDILFLPSLFVGLFVCLFAHNFNKNHLNSAIAGSNMIFGIHIRHIKPHIFRGEISRSMSSFKVKGKKNATLTLIITFHLLQIATSYLACVFISSRRIFWWVTCQGQGHSSR